MKAFNCKTCGSSGTAPAFKPWFGDVCPWCGVAGVLEYV